MSESYNYIRENFVSKYPNGHVFICVEDARIKGFDCRRDRQSDQKIINLETPVRLVGNTINRQVDMFPAGTSDMIMEAFSE